MSGHSQFYIETLTELKSKSKIIEEMIASLQGNVPERDLKELASLSKAFQSAIDILKNKESNMTLNNLVIKKSPVSA